MNWNDVVQKDFTLSRIARQLAYVVASNFAAVNARYAVFFDTQAAGILESTSSAVRQARLELARAGYLRELQSNSGGRPSYALRLGHPAYGDGDEAA